jgi:hypothetical protein
MKDLVSSEFSATYSSPSGQVERNYQQLLLATEQGDGVLPRLYHNRIINNIEVSANGATADLVLRETTHKLRLFKSDQGWKIIRDEYTDKSRHG